MLARDRHEAHRVATPLELLFDLCFVVAVAPAAAGLHHAIVAGHGLAGVLGFVQVFFAIWWAWMNFTWYASAYDIDDVPYRLKVLVQIVGVLVLAAGVPRAFEHGDYSVITIGYAIMRVGLVALWLRASIADQDPGRRRTARRYAFGIMVCEVGWTALLAIPADVWWVGWLVMLPCELAVPMWAERTGATTWHAHHIIERYSLLVLIVIGESVLSATVAIQRAVDAGHLSAMLVAVIAGAVLTVFSAWWIYFAEPPHHVQRTSRDAFMWGYGHYLVFSSLAAVGAGLAAATDLVVSGTGELWVAASAVAIPTSVFLAALWLLVLRPNTRGARVALAYAVAIALILGSIAVPLPVLPVGVVLVLLVVVTRGGQPGGAAHAAEHASDHA